MAKGNGKVPPIGAKYEVGYARPPTEGQFKPGRSGNPKGRPKGSRNKPEFGERRLQDLLLKEASRLIEVRDGERRVTMSVMEATVRSLGLKAAKGDLKAQKIFIEEVGRVEAEHQNDLKDYVATAVAYKKRTEIEVAERKARGQSCDDILPHPDHIILHFDTGKVEIRGPRNRQERDDYWKMLKFKADIEDTFKLLTERLSSVEAVDKALRTREDEERIVGLKSVRKKCQKKLKETAMVMPDWDPLPEPEAKRMLITRRD